MREEKIIVRVIVDSTISGIVGRTFRMKTSTLFGRLMKLWCKYLEVGPEEVIFKRDWAGESEGLVIRENMTVAGCRWRPCARCGELIIKAVPRDAATASALGGEERNRRVLTGM